MNEFLYKYKSINDDKDLYEADDKTFKDWGLKNISLNQIWFPKPSGLNDPFDCQIKIKMDKEYYTNLDLYADAVGRSQDVNRIIKSGKKHGKSDEKIIKEIEGRMAMLSCGGLKKILEKHKKAVEYASANIGVLSLSETPDNLLMWAYYAKYHQGYCLEFSTQEENPLTKKNYLNNLQYTQRVNYDNEYPTYKTLNIMDADKNDLAQRLLLHKSEEWKHENEWRVLIHDGGKSMPYPSKLTSVILGCNMTDKAKDAVKDAVHRAEVNLGYKILIKNAKIKNDEFKVVVK